jgi:hypothetical protein
VGGSRETKAARSRLAEFADSSSGVLNLHIFGRKRRFGKLSWETNPRHWLKERGFGWQENCLPKNIYTWQRQKGFVTDI